METDWQWSALHSRRNVWQRNCKIKSLKDKLYSGNNMLILKPKLLLSTVVMILKWGGKGKFLNCTVQNKKENWIEGRKKWQKTQRIREMLFNRHATVSLLNKERRCLLSLYPLPVHAKWFARVASQHWQRWTVNWCQNLLVLVWETIRMYQVSNFE